MLKFNMNYTTQKGLMTELFCQIDFARYGILLSQPVTNDSRYDFLADINDKIYKIQCKSAISIDEQNSAFTFTVASKNWNTSKYKDYHGQIDYFYTYYNNQGYLIPIAEVGVKSKTLRFYTDKSNAANPQITWARDYQFEKIITELLPDNISVLTSSNLFHGKTRNKCVNCGKEISRQATYCKSCAGKRQHKLTIVKPTKEELKSMIRTLSFTQIGKNYGISDNAVRKWCDSYNLPRNAKEIKLITDEEWVNI